MIYLQGRPCTICVASGASGLNCGTLTLIAPHKCIIVRHICASDEEVRPPHNCMHPYGTIQLRLAYLYVNQVANAIVRMDDRLTLKKIKTFFFLFFFQCHAIYPHYFAIDRSITIDVLGTPDVNGLQSHKPSKYTL